MRENVGLLVGLSGGTGSGKTYSAMRLAKGIAADAPYAVIDTEAGRSTHYADRFRFDHGNLTPPFRPDRYAEAIAAADAAHYPVIVVDSMSHEWAGDGGILDWQEDELARMAGDDVKRRDAAKMASWIKPKMAHKAMVQRLLQIRAHLILCFRAEPKIEMVRNAAGKYEIIEKQSLTGLHGWIPIAEKNLPYELTASFLLMADHPGVPLPIKLQEQHRAIFPLDQPITEESGIRLAAWARGGTVDGDSSAPTTADPRADHWADRIRDAATKGALVAVGKQLRAAAKTLQPTVVAQLRAAYEARLQTFKPTNARPATPITAGEMDWSSKP
jgi:hypothetical protein